MSIPQPNHPWNRQPGEPAGDYQLFLTWLRLRPPRHLRPAAVTLKCPVSRLRKLSAARNWRARARAYDECLANAASQNLDRDLSKETADLRKRAELFRQQEWLLHEEMLAAAWEAIGKIRASKRTPNLSEIVRLLQLASDLGRRACGMPLQSSSSNALASAY